MARRYFFGLCIACLIVVASAAISDVLMTTLLEMGTLWVKATQELFEIIKNTILSIPERATPWTILQTVLGAIALYYVYLLMWAPMNRIKLLGDSGYVPESGLSKKEVANLVRRQRDVGNPPPVYPNGWFSVLESRDLTAGQVRNVCVLGE